MVVVLNDHGQLLRAVSGEQRVEVLLGQAHRVVRRQVLLTHTAQSQVSQRNDQQDHADRDRDGEGQRALHDPVDELAPETGLDLFAGLGFLQPLREPLEEDPRYFPVTQERNAQCRPHPEGIDMRAEDCQAGREESDGQQRRQADGGEDRVRQGVHEALWEGQQASAGGDDQHRGERHGPPGGHHSASDRGLGVVALGELLPEAAHHEEAVIDSDTEADQRHHRLGKEVHGPEDRDETQDTQGARDTQPADDGW